MIGKFLNYCVLLFFVLSFQNKAQNVYINIPSTGVYQMSKWILDQNIVYSPRSSKQPNVKYEQNLLGEKFLDAASTNNTVIATWQNLTGSANIYGVLNSSSKPLQYHPILNVVSFIHLKNTTYTSSPGNGNGDVVAMISSNAGATWDSTCIWNDTAQKVICPQGGVYTPVGNTNIQNAYIVGSGGTSNSGTVSGNFYASKQLNLFNNTADASPNGMQFFSNTSPLPSFGKHDQSSNSFCVTQDGKMRSAANILNDANAITNVAYGITGGMIVEGSFNAGTFLWSGISFTPAITPRTDGSLQMANKPLMAWNSSGSIGYMVLIGSAQSAVNSNRGWQPIVYKTTNYGVTWSPVPNLDFNSSFFQPLKNSIKAVNTNSNLVIPHFNIKEGIDAIVDVNNNLHIASTVVGTVSDHNDSLDYTYLFGAEGYHWPHTPGARAYLYDFVTNGVGWTYKAIDSLMTEIPGKLSTDAGYNYNPWNADVNGRKVSSGARIQLSRTDDGKYVVYTYTESDTNFTLNSAKWNHLPNLKAKLYVAFANNVVNTKINVTKPPSGQGNSPMNFRVANRAMFHFASPNIVSAGGIGGGFIIIGDCGVPGSTATLSLPMTVSNCNPYIAETKNEHWFSNVTLHFSGNNAYNSFPLITSLKANTIENNNFSAYPIPANNILQIELTGDETEIEMYDVTGKIVRSNKIEGNGTDKITLTVSDLENGVYFIKTISGSGVRNRKVIIAH